MKKRFLAMILVLGMVLSLVPFSAFAEENDLDATEIESVNIAEETIGLEAEIGSTLYYIEDGNLFASENSARPREIDTYVSWVIAKNGSFYWSKVNEHNTTEIYSTVTGEKEVFAKVFVPVEAFDVDGDELYYLYNGEIDKLNVTTGEEETVICDISSDSFCLEFDEIKIFPSKKVYNHSGNIQLLSYSYGDYRTTVDKVNNSNPKLQAQLHRYDVSGICNVSSMTMLLNRMAKLKGSNIEFDIFDVFRGNDVSTWEYKGTTSNGYDDYKLSSGTGSWASKTYKDKTESMTCMVSSQKINSKQALANILNEHPEGIALRVYYPSHPDGEGHVIVITDYVSNNGEYQFYAIDPVDVYDGIGREKLEDTWMYRKKTGSNFFSLINFGAYIYNCEYHTCSSYKGCGICKKCGQAYDWKSTLDESCSGVYTLKSNKAKTKTSIKELPYDAATLVAKGVNAEYEVIGSVKNAYYPTTKKKWYAVGYGDYENGKFVQKVGYVYGPSIDDNYTKLNSDKFLEAKMIILNSGNIQSSNPKTISSGGTQKTTTTNNSKTQSIVQASVNVNLSSVPSEIYVGQSYPLRGTITSSYPMYYLSGTIIDSSGGNVIPWIDFPGNGAKTINITQNHVLNTKMTFNSIKTPGNYKIKIIVNCNSNGSQDNLKTFEFPFTVKGENQCEAPSINVSSIEGGQRVTFKCNDGNGTIHYSINGAMEQTCKSGGTKDLTTVGNYNISAYVTRANYNQGPTKNKTVSVSKVSTPVIGDVKYGKDNAWVTISGGGTIYYTDNGKKPSKSSSKYNGTIYFDKTTTIKAIAIQNGKVNSDIVSKELKVSVPDAPTGVSLYNTKAKIAQGKTATVQWKAMDRATSYEARLYYNGQQVGKTYETKGTTAAFKLSDVGVYSIKVAAKNFKGTSAESAAVTVESMAPVTVTFVDRILREGDVTEDVVEQIQENIDNQYEDDTFSIEGNVLSVQTIDYDSKPSLPLWADKKGFSKQYFDGKAFSNITADTTVYAYYAVNRYYVEFYDTSSDDPRNISSQEVFYTFAADEPTNYIVPVGYIFSGWSVDNSHSSGFDYKFVDGNIKLNTAYSWGNDNLPVVLDISSIVRDNDGYKVNLKIKNNPVNDTQGRLVVALYTNDGKNVYTQIRDINVDLGKQNDWTSLETITLLYNGKISSASAFVVAVDGNKTGGALSEATTYDAITYAEGSNFWSDWSEWSETKAVADNYTKVETKTQYKYQDKSTKTSTTTKSLSGWTYDSTKATTGSWSSWSKTKATAQNTDALKREVQTKEIAATYKTQYRYGRYRNGYNICACKKCGQNVDSRAEWTYQTSAWVDSPVSLDTSYDYSWPANSSHNHKDVIYTNYSSSEGIYRDHWYRYVVNGAYYYFLDSTRQVVDTEAYTKYRYRDTTYVHSFYKWSIWSDWSDTKYTSSSTRNVETRTMYRYKTSGGIDSEKEEDTVHTYSKSGVLDNITEDVSGNVATVMIYKKTNSDPTEEQIEYIGQIIIGEGNSYEINANTKEAIDYANTGDFIVTLALEGSEKLINIDCDEAPRPTHTVDFYCDGEVFKSVEVEEGNGVDVNDIGIPEAEGKRFLKWDKSVVNVDHNLSVNAVWEANDVNIVFVDYENETTEIYRFTYGEPIVVPDVSPVEGKTFNSWENIDYENEVYATEDMVITAIWDDVYYDVEFRGFNDETVGEIQKVKFGDSAVLPEYSVKDGVAYSWDLTGDEWWNVTNNMVIYPYMPQEVEVDAPTISAPTNSAYGECIAELESSDEHGKIFYSMDAGITEQDAKKFVEGRMFGEELGIDTQSISLMDAEGSENEEGTNLEEIDGSDEYGDDPTDFIVEYTEPISVYAGSVVYAFTVDEAGNISPISVFQYEANYNDEAFGDTSYEYKPDTNLPQITMSTITAQLGETVTIPVNIKNNMGITNLDLVLGYDTDALILDSVENGNVFDDSDFMFDTREDGSCKFVWETASDNINDGILMNLTFTVKDTATEPKYVLDLDVEYSADENDEEWYFITVPGAITDKEIVNGIVGDVNGDGEIDFADGILILKHDVGLSTLTKDKATLGDVNGDGEVDFADAILVLKYDVGLIFSFKK